MAETMVNWLPKTQGAMRLRPGGQHIGGTINDTGAEWIPFVASTTDAALLELTHLKMRVWISDVLVARQATAAIADFSADTGAWQGTLSSGGATMTYNDTGLVLDGTNINGTARAVRKVTLGDTGEINVEHGLKIHVKRGPVQFRIGTDTGDDSYMAYSSLRTGWHHLAFTPTAAEYVMEFQNDTDIDRFVASVTIDTGTVEVVTPYREVDLPYIRTDQSADVVFADDGAHVQQRIERRGDGRSWSVVEYRTDNGPFIVGPSTAAKLKPNASFGNTTLSADKPFFETGHVGALIRMFHSGQNGVYRLGSEESITPAITMTGIGDTGGQAERIITVVTTGTWSATISVERSYDDPDYGFHQIQTITTNTTTTILDSDDNVKVYYRFRIKNGNYTSGTAILTVTYPGGGIDGIARITDYNSPTSVQAEVLSRFGDSGYTDDWAEGWWSDAGTWPSAVSLHEGRLWHFGGTNLYGSVSDDYENYDANFEGDAGPIVRTIGRGPVDNINFALALSRLMIGTAGSEITIKSSSFDDPLTPTNTNAKTSSTQGSAVLKAVVLDNKGVFVHRSLKHLFLLDFDANSGEYKANELTLLVPELLSAGVVDVAVQRQPDTRVHLVLADGTVAILTYEEQEEVLCWSLYQSTAASGVVEKVAVLPGTDEDQVYYQTKRTINGANKRYLEKLAFESQAAADTGGITYPHWMVDCGIRVQQASSPTVGGLSHLEGETVLVVNSDTGAVLCQDDTGGTQVTYTVSGGAITVPVAVTDVIVGLPYLDRATDQFDAKYKTTKLAYGTIAGTALTQPKRVNQLGFVLGPTHNNGLYFGKTLDTGDLFPMPRKLKERTLTDSGEIFDGLDRDMSAFAGTFDTDARLCLAAKAPRIATVMAAIIGIAGHDKV